MIVVDLSGYLTLFVFSVLHPFSFFRLLPYSICISPVRCLLVWIICTYHAHLLPGFRVYEFPNYLVCRAACYHAFLSCSKSPCLAVSLFAKFCFQVCLQISPTRCYASTGSCIKKCSHDFRAQHARRLPFTKNRNLINFDGGVTSYFVNMSIKSLFLGRGNCR